MNAILEPFFSCKNQFNAVNKTVDDISSGPMKLRALLIAINT